MKEGFHQESVPFFHLVQIHVQHRTTHLKNVITVSSNIIIYICIYKLIWREGICTLWQEHKRKIKIPQLLSIPNVPFRSSRIAFVYSIFWWLSSSKILTEIAFPKWYSVIVAIAIILGLGIQDLHLEVNVFEGLPVLGIALFPESRARHPICIILRA